MSSIDQRTVKMAFDNAEFEKRVGTTLGTLDKLKQSLNFTGATKGMEDINAAASRISFDRLADSIDSIQYRFSVLGEFVHNTFMGMIDSAVNAGRQIADALLFEPLKDGFSEYETQMNSVQTILANTESKGTTLTDVNNALDELNAYADKTIYNFTEMTRNIGTFTAAGVDLNTSVNAIQGIANLAAVSGSNSEQASRAMYQLSQALSSGVMHLQDWNSVVNAGMGGEVFQKAIMDTARVHGIAIDEMKESAGSFRAMLNAQDYGDWFTSDILLESLEKFRAGSEGITQEQLTQMQELYRARGYTEDQIKSLTESQRVLTDAEIEEIKATWRAKGYTEEQVEEIFKMGQTATNAATKVKTFTQLIDTLKEALGSGWTQSWEYVIGDFEQAKELWTEISDVLSIYINASANARNATLKEWSEGGGRTAVIDSIRNSFQALLGVLIPIKRAFDNVFPAITSKQLIDYSNKLKEFTAGLKVTDEEGKNIQKTAIKIFKYLEKAVNGIVNLGKTAIDIFTTVGSAIGKAFNVKDLSIIGKIVNRFERFAEAIRPSETVLTNLGRLITGITSIFKAFVTIAVNAGSALFDAFGKVFSGLSGDGENFMAYLGNIGDKLTELSDKLINTFTIKNLSGFDSIATAFSNFIDIIRQAVDIPDILGNIINYIFGIDFSGILNGINGVAEGASSGVDVIHNAIVNFMSSGAIPNLIAKISEFVSGINWKAIFNIFSHVESFVATKSLMSMAKSFKNLPESLGELIDKIKDVSNTPVGAVTNLLNGIKDSLEVWQKNLKAAILIEIGVALVAIAMAIKTVSEVDPSRVVSSLELLGGGIAETLVLVKALDKMDIKNVPNLWGLAQVMGQMANLLKAVGSIEPERVKPTVIAMGVLMGELAVALKIMNGISLDAKETMVSTIAIFVLTQAIKSLSKSLKILGALSWKQIVKGLGAIGGLMIGLAATIRLLPTD